MNTVLRMNTMQRHIILVGLLMLIGGGVSIALTQNHDWLSFHLSRLGEGRQLSSYLFNATVAFSGLLILELGNALAADKAWRMKATQPQQRAAHTAFRLIALCLVGLSIFPFDKFPAVHNIFGYGMTVIFLTAVMSLTLGLQLFSHAFKNITWTVVAAMLIMFVFYFLLGNRMITLLQIQLIGLVFFFVWLWQLARGLSAESQPRQVR